MHDIISYTKEGRIENKEKKRQQHEELQGRNEASKSI